MAVYLENNYYCRKGSVTRVQCRVEQEQTEEGATHLRMGGVAARLP
jgi:hypothetical protein